MNEEIKRNCERVSESSQCKEERGMSSGVCGEW